MTTTKPEPETIPPSDERAARKVTVTGWLSRDGRFYGDDERMARWAGSTHAVCETCGTTTTKSWTKCEACREKADIERFNAMPELPWDGEAMLYSDRFDAFYREPGDALEALDTYEPDEDSSGGRETLADARLIICRPQYAQIDSEIFHDILPGDEADPPQELLDAIDAFNEKMKDVVISWEPGKFRLKLDAEGKVVMAPLTSDSIHEINNRPLAIVACGSE